ncbi:hypothetical protein [Oricola sp.]
MEPEPSPTRGDKMQEQRHAFRRAAASSSVQPMLTGTSR